MKEYNIYQARRALRKQVLRLQNQGFPFTKERPQQVSMARQDMNEGVNYALQGHSLMIRGLGEQAADDMELASGKFVDAWNHLHASEIFEYTPSTGKRTGPRYTKMNQIRISRPVRLVD